MTVSSYGFAKSIQTFRLSEIKGGEPISENDDVEHTLVLRFATHSFTEHHPYGNGLIDEVFYEIIDDSYEYELDGIEVGREGLEEMFGSAWVSALSERMKNNATSIQSEPDYD